MKQATQDSTVGPITGQTIGFPGVSGEIDDPFQTADGLPLGPGLKEAEQMLDLAWAYLDRIADVGNDTEVKTAKFLVLAGSSIVSSLARGFAKHPLSKWPDGYHAHPGSFASPPRPSTSSAKENAS